MQLIEIFDRGAEINPSGVAFVTCDASRAWTYSEASDITHRIAASLTEAGAVVETRVGVLSPNDTLAFLCVLGASRAGCTWVGLNARSTAADLADLMELVECEVLFYHPSLVESVEHILANVTTIETVVCLAQGGRAGDPLLADWMARPKTRVPLPPLDPEAIAMLVGTGGTTGRPKAVQIPNRAFQTMIYAFEAHMPEKDPVQILAAPMTHAAGAVTFPVLAAGGVNVVHPGVVPADILASIERHRVTRLFLPPTAIYALLAHPDVRGHDYSSLRYFLYAAAPMSVEKLKEAMDVFGPVMTQSFGQAEAPMIVTFLGPEEHAEALRDPRREHRLASCGRQSYVATVGIMDDAGNLVPRGERGEIVVRSMLNMRGYLKDPEQTASVDRGGGWHGTGDIGVKDDDGYVYIVDRKRDMIISGGFNVFPSEVEQVIWSHGAVNDCAVIGVPDERWGERVTAVVELKDGATVGAEELIGLCKERLGSVKAPKEVIFRELPRSAVGKVLKRTLRDEFWEGRARSV